jgi:hypothetical protein
LQQADPGFYPEHSTSYCESSTISSPVIVWQIPASVKVFFAKPDNNAKNRFFVLLKAHNVEYSSTESELKHGELT